MGNKNDLFEDREYITLLVYKAIEQALKDLSNYPTTPADYYIPKGKTEPLKVKIQKDAKKWLMSDDCALYCEAIRIDHSWLIKEINRVENNGYSIKIKRERICKPYKTKDRL